MQFFYEIKELINKEGEEEKQIVTHDSFNTEYVIRTRELPDRRRVVVLDDGHTESRYDKYPDIKGGKIVGESLRKEASYYQSQIMLSEEDSKRYVEASNVS